MHSFEVHSNESACRKSGLLSLEQVNRAVNLNRFRQDLPARLDIRRLNFPVPLHEVIRESLGSYTVEPHVPLFFMKR